MSREGIVLTGVYVGWRVIVEDDRDGDTGGHYLYLKNGDAEVFDYWFESEVGLEAQLVDFKVSWIS
ncbi:hypothetical protein AUC61_21710 [Pseudomonas sp. S25]|uniref:Uncharacterized protein n=1 Tax=Pseudomonas maioricensis TaxID=1766623 RepID=A0ABS9ZPE3_9PSED|nr:hypothetical protein [Pseudomonas sp. S25]MCI8212152.1 hypothetical protein [Pseudomonas sp. S25]